MAVGPHSPRKTQHAPGTGCVLWIERATGFEPVTFSLARRRSTTEPRPHGVTVEKYSSSHPVWQELSSKLSPENRAGWFYDDLSDIQPARIDLLAQQAQFVGGRRIDGGHVVRDQ
jgi:hypothetical protein